MNRDLLLHAIFHRKIKGGNHATSQRAILGTGWAVQEMIVV